VFEPAREALLEDPTVVPALQAVVEVGLSAEARVLAERALLALSDKKLEMAVEGQKHIMLSYQWDAQGTIQRINESLISRGFVTWFDLTNMKGSTMDASESSWQQPASPFVIPNCDIKAKGHHCSSFQLQMSDCIAHCSTYV
jgi:hypothetical protein